MPVFWGCPLPPHDYPYYWVILNPKSKEDKVKVIDLKECAKILNFLILTQSLHATRLLKLLDKMCKYEMELTCIVEDTERTRFCPQTDRRTDRQGQTSIPLSTSLKRGDIKISWHFLSTDCNLPYLNFSQAWFSLGMAMILSGFIYEYIWDCNSPPANPAAGILSLPWDNNSTRYQRFLRI